MEFVGGTTCKHTPYSRCFGHSFGTTYCLAREHRYLFLRFPSWMCVRTVAVQGGAGSQGLLNRGFPCWNTVSLLAHAGQMTRVRQVCTCSCIFASTIVTGRTVLMMPFHLTVHSNGIYRCNEKTDSEELVSNFTISLNGLVEVAKEAGGPGYQDEEEDQFYLPHKQRRMFSMIRD